MATVEIVHKAQTGAMTFADVAEFVDRVRAEIAHADEVVVGREGAAVVRPNPSMITGARPLTVKARVTMGGKLKSLAVTLGEGAG